MRRSLNFGREITTLFMRNSDLLVHYTKGTALPFTEAHDCLFLHFTAFKRRMC